MLLPNQMEMLAQLRIQQWEKELQHRKLLAQMASAPKPWQQWMGELMVWGGTRLLCFGARMTQRACPPTLATVGKSA